jgi:hypothetical protein
MLRDNCVSTLAGESNCNFTSIFQLCDFTRVFKTKLSPTPGFKHH